MPPQSSAEPFRVPLAKPATVPAIPPFLREICERLIAQQREDELLPWADRALLIDPLALDFVEMRALALSLGGLHREAAETLHRHRDGLRARRQDFEAWLSYELAMAGDLEAGAALLDEARQHAVAAGDTAIAELATRRLGDAQLRQGKPQGFANWLHRNEDPDSSGS
ncbi:MAG: hypothetical protein VB138_13540 [Burkholderia sp.]